MIIVLFLGLMEAEYNLDVEKRRCWLGGYFAEIDWSWMWSDGSTCKFFKSCDSLFIKSIFCNDLLFAYIKSIKTYYTNREYHYIFWHAARP